MRISILLPDLRSGGVERLSLTLAREFQRQGHAPEFVLLRGRGELLAEAQDSFPVHTLGAARVRNLPAALVSHLRQHPPEALLIALWPLTALGPMLARAAGQRCPIAISEHGILSAQYRPRGRAHTIAMRSSMALGYRLAQARIGVSAGVADDMAALSGLHRSRFRVIHNPSEPRPAPAPTALAEAEALWGVPPGRRYLTVGRIKPVKNHPLLLRAFARQADPQARLMLVGNGEEAAEAHLHRLAADLGIADRVIFAGFRADPTPFYATADCFVLSSDAEGFGNVIVEALQQGLQVISTDCPTGPTEILQAGRFGRLVPVGQVDALAQAMAEAPPAAPDPQSLRRRAADFGLTEAAAAYIAALSGQ